VAARSSPELAPRLLFDWREAPDGLDYADPGDRRKAVVAASAAAGLLWDVEARVRHWDDPEFGRNEWIRYYGNKWVEVAEDSWLRDHPKAWAGCRGEWDLAGDEPAVLAIDLSLSRDSTAVVEVTRLRDGRVAVTGRIWQPVPGRLVPHKDVSQHARDRIEALGERFRGIVYDPALMAQIAEDIEDAGIVPIEFSQQPGFMAPACGLTFDHIINGVIVHDGDGVLSGQVLAAAKRPFGEKGFTLSKGRSKLKIDGAVAMCMGVWALQQMEEAPDPMEMFW
jgi:phage terminase large subunit-like protein